MAVARAPLSTRISSLQHALHGDGALVDGLVAGMLAQPGRAAYKRFLAATYQFEYAVEVKLSQVYELTVDFLGLCMKTGTLGDDLVALGIDGDVMEQFVREPDVPEITCAAEALGWIYVLRHLRGRYGALYRAMPNEPTEARFLKACSVAAPLRWLELEVELEYFLSTRGDLYEVAAAARMAFAKHRAWCEGVRTR